MTSPTTLIQLNPPLPMNTPKGSGICHFLLDYVIEDDIIWGVVDDATGQVWWWPNQQIRFMKNISMGRPDPEKP